MGLKSKILSNVLLAPYTSFKIGGPAKYFAEAESIDEIQEFCEWAHNMPVFVLGGGSNVLISDKGLNGLVIRIENCKLKIVNCSVCVDTGALLSKLVSETTNAGLSGLEWAIGIPGTVGGAVCGNAGAFGEAISGVIKSVNVLDINNITIKQYNNLNCNFSYRESVFKHDPKLIILDAVLALKKEKPDAIKGRMKNCFKQRTGSFAQGQKCAGCFFKNLEWKRKDIDKEYILSNFPELRKFADKPKISAGFLIDFLGFKGKRIGDAMVSDKHANFILNVGSAKAEQVMMLAGLIKNKIFSHYGFALEEEVQLIGFD
jgi:UDP-N-acetylmuramate dehydrogenase